MQNVAQSSGILRNSGDVSDQSVTAEGGVFIFSDQIFYTYLSSLAYLQCAESRLITAQSQGIARLTADEEPSEQLISLNESIDRSLSSILLINMAAWMKYGALSRIVSSPRKGTVSGASQRAVASTGLFQGRGQGYTTDLHDSFGNGLAVLQADLPENPEKDPSFLCYSVMKDAKMLIVLAKPGQIETHIKPEVENTSLSVRGIAELILKQRNKPDLHGQGTFALEVLSNPVKILGFRISANADHAVCLNHESGKIIVI